MKLKLAIISFIMVTICSLTIGQTITNQFYNVKSGNGNGIKFWNNSNYKIHMGNTINYKYGPVTGFSIKMNMSNNSGRGWVWGVNNKVPVAALDIYGNFQIKNLMKIETTRDASKLPGSGGLEIGGSLRLDDNEIITNENDILYLNNDNNGDVIIDNGTFAVDASTNLVKLTRTREASKTPGSGALEIGGSLRLDGNEVITNANKALYLNQDNNGDVVIDANTLRVDASANKVSIGYLNAISKLDVAGNIRANHFTDRSNFTEIGHGGTNGYIQTVGTGDLDFRHDDQTLMSLKDDGKVIIGDVPTESGYKLLVEDGIITEKVRVAVKTTNDWADYVFEEDYEILPIADLKEYVSKNKHLPNVPSAEQVVENGINMAEMDSKLLEKIEEAYLYIIDLQEQIEALQSKVNSNH